MASKIILNPENSMGTKAPTASPLIQLLLYLAATTFQRQLFLRIYGKYFNLQKKKKLAAIYRIVDVVHNRFPISRIRLWTCHGLRSITISELAMQEADC